MTAQFGDVWGEQPATFLPVQESISSPATSCSNQRSKPRIKLVPRVRTPALAPLRPRPPVQSVTWRSKDADVVSESEEEEMRSDSDYDIISDSDLMDTLPLYE